MRVVLFNVCYSANLGDGLLASCLAAQIAAHDPSADVINVDLAGRVAYGDSIGRRQIVAQILYRMPDPIRRVVSSSLIRFEIARKLESHWRGALATADTAVLGGGNLFTDTDLNFPLKIAALVREIGAAKLPWVIHGVGVGGNWSTEGKRLVDQSLRTHPPCSVAVRDARSKANWDCLFASSRVPTATICVDPAILAANCYPVRREHRHRSHPLLGLNVAAPSELAFQPDRKPQPTGALTEWWIRVIENALSTGFAVRLFTNGSPLDEIYLSHLRKRLQGSARHTEIMVANRPDTPASLVSLISGCDVIAGYRMHAHITAYSYRIPSVGFRWDVKVDSFFQSVGRTDYLIEACRTSPDNAVDVFLRAFQVGVEQHVWTATTDTAQRVVRELAKELQGFEHTKACSSLSKKS